MKTSNIILLTMFSILTLFIAAVPILYQHEISSIPPSIDYNKTTFKPGKIINLVNIPNATFFQYDSLMIETTDSTLQILDHPDTLTIVGNSTTASALIYVPNNHHIFSTNSTILLYGLLRTLDAPNITFTLTDSQLHSLPVSRDNHVTQNLQTLTIINNVNSSVDLRGAFDIASLVLINVDQFTCAPEVNILAHDINFPGLRLTATQQQGRFIQRAHPTEP